MAQCSGGMASVLRSPIVLGVLVTVGVVLSHASPCRDVLVLVNDALSLTDRLIGRSEAL